MPELPGSSQAAAVVTRVQGVSARTVNTVLGQEPSLAEYAPLLWAYPGTIGYQVAGIEGEIVTGGGLVGNLGGDVTVVFNWRFGELGVLVGGGAKVGVGAGAKGSVSFTAGPVVAYGASSLKPLAGNDWQGSLSASVAPEVNVGVALDVSQSASDDWSREIDPVSHMHITTVGLKGSIGYGKGADVALTGGAPCMNRSWLIPIADLY